MSKMTIGCHHWNEHQKLLDWLVFKNGCASFIDYLAISSTQQEMLDLLYYKLSDSYNSGWATAF